MAALTEMEKYRLDKIVTSVLSEIFSEKNEISMNELNRMILSNVNRPQMSSPFTSISAAYRRVERKFQNKEYCLILVENNIKKISDNNIFFVESYTDDKIYKNKNILTFAQFPGLTYDFIEKKFNREISNCIILSNYMPPTKLEIYFEKILEMLSYEWIFNYVDNLREIKKIQSECEKEDYQKMPTGIIKIIEENNNTLTASMINEYRYINTFGKYYKIAMKIMKTGSYYGEKLTFDQLKYFYFNNNNSLNGILKMINNSFLMGEDSYNYSDLYEFIRMYCKASEIDDNPITLDYNRSIQHNVEIMKSVLDREKNKILAKQLQRLNFINGITKDNLIVIVPQNQQDKIDEGKMQHNCVGSYYDNSIIEGKNLIYFIRKTNSPNKSYITCRYNIASESTAEYKTANNLPVQDNTAIDFIDEITEIINANLS